MKKVQIQTSHIPVNTVYIMSELAFLLDPDVIQAVYQV